jgi:ribulose-bisphosphate carboxylase large chain
VSGDAVLTYRITAAETERAAEAVAAAAAGRVAALRPAAAPAEAEVDVAVALGADLFALLGAALAPFDLPQLAGVRLAAISPPAALTAAAPGPAFGLPGTRRLLGVDARPMVGSIIKPSVGLTPRQTADRVRELGLAGIDFVKDDELMADPPSSPFEERVAAVMGAVREVAATTGRTLMFAFNVSAHDPETIVARHDVVAEAGGTCVMVSLNQVGFAGVARLRAHATLPIHGHRNGWGALTRDPALGLDFRAYATLWRLAGVDQLHVNGLANKFWEPDDSVVAAVAACREPLGDQLALCPVVSSGQWGGQAPETYARTGTTDVLYLAGGGIQGHPGGPAAGVRAIQAAWEAAVDGVPLAERARDVPELAAALERFGR